MQIELPVCRAKREIIRRWIESLMGERSVSATKEFLLPEGEGQDEGELRLITQHQNMFAHTPTESFRIRGYSSE
jgi:hypothetical protein